MEKSINNIRRCRISVELCAVDRRDVPAGMLALGTVTRKTLTQILAMDERGAYWAISAGVRPEPLPAVKVQSAIAAVKTGMSGRARPSAGPGEA